MANKLGIQCQERHEETYRYNRKLRPVVVKSINIVDHEHYAKLAAENPGVELVYRQVPNGPWDNEGDGRRWAEHLHRLIGHIPEITMVEGHNEWVHSPPHNSPEDFAKADRFMVELIDKVHELWDGRVHAVVLNASCGHFDEDIVDFFPRTLAKLQECGKCLLGLHEYDHPDQDMIGDEGHNLCGKFLRNLAGLKAAGYDRVRIALTECGVDSGVNGSGHIGFKYWGEGAAERYLNERNLGWYLPLVQETEGIVWATIFICGGHGDWGTFDIKGTPVIDGIGEIFSNWAPPEPPPNGGDSMIRVFNINGVELFGEEALDLIAYHGITVREPTNMRQGEWYWAVVKMEEREGPAAFIYTGLLTDGSPAAGQETAWAWADNMGEADDIGGDNYPTDWQKQADLGVLNENGNVGPGFGQKGWWHDPYKPGPGRAWIRDPLRWAVELTGIGMEGGTNHRTMYATWQLWQWAGGEPPESPDGKLDEILERVESIEEIAGGVDAKADQIIELLGQTPEEPEPPEPEVFQVEFFNNVDLAGSPAHTMIETQPFWHDWGSGSPVPGKVNLDYISGRWSGKFAFEAGAYMFNVKTDDGARLRVGGKLVLDKWYDQGPTLYSVSVTLAAGLHEVVLEWFERAGDATLHFNWERR